MHREQGSVPWSLSWLLKKCCPGSQNKWAAPSAGVDAGGCDVKPLATIYYEILAKGERKEGSKLNIKRKTHCTHIRFAWAETVRPCCSVIFREKHFLKTFTFGSPGKKNRRLSTVRAIDCSLTTSIDWPMSTVLGMLPRVPLTYSATSWTVNICSSSSKISGKLFNSAALRGKQKHRAAISRIHMEQIFSFKDATNKLKVIIQMNENAFLHDIHT